MILGFSTILNGKETFFVQKIWACLLKIDFDLYDDYLHPADFPEQMPWPPSSYKNYTPKLHTLRDDPKNRWKVGTIIDFFINVRQKNMFRFAPVLPVVSTQMVKICYITDAPYCYNFPEIQIDGKVLDSSRWLEFAQNDGFDTVEDFFAYFNKACVRKLIHWTDLRY